MKILDMTRIAKKYVGKWVALAGPNTTKVAGHGDTMEQALEMAYEKGFKRPVLQFMSKNILKPHIGLFPIDIF